MPRSQAGIDCFGAFDSKTKWSYQTGLNCFRRHPPTAIGELRAGHESNRGGVLIAFTLRQGRLLPLVFAPNASAISLAPPQKKSKGMHGPAARGLDCVVMYALCLAAGFGRFGFMTAAAFVFSDWPPLSLKIGEPATRITRRGGTLLHS